MATWDSQKHGTFMLFCIVRKITWVNEKFFFSFINTATLLFVWNWGTTTHEEWNILYENIRQTHDERVQITGGHIALFMRRVVPPVTSFRVRYTAKVYRHPVTSYPPLFSLFVSITLKRLKVSVDWSSGRKPRRSCWKWRLAFFGISFCATF